jgi:hypothetical protein
MNILGSSASQSQTNTVTNAFAPVVTVGDKNVTSQDLSQKADATSTNSNKDDFGLSAGVAVGSGSSAMGGAVGVGDKQPMQSPSITTPNGVNMQYVAIGGLLLIVTSFFIFKGSKK